MLAALPLLAAPGMDDWPPGFLLPGAVGGTAASGAPGADPEPTGSGIPSAGEGAARAAAAAAAAADAGEPGTAASGEPGAAASGEPRTAACLPRALFVELQPPPPAVARSLRLSAGQPAAMITVRFDEPAGGRAAALTVAVLRPDMFRIVVESPASGSPGRTAGSFSGAWTYALQDWEP